MKPDYKNWVPKSMVYGLAGGTIVAFAVFMLLGATGTIFHGTPRLVCDIWSGAYKAVFMKKRCEDNAKTEGVTNVRFEEGNAIHLPYKDESFDAVTSNYVYHNIAGYKPVIHQRKEVLLRTICKNTTCMSVHRILQN